MQTIDELKRLQAQPLEKKIVMTSQRIRQWVARYGEDGVYVSFSGGKDSTVLLDIVRNVCGYENIPAVFVDVPTQYPELRTFAETFDNLIELRPKISFVQVCDKYGFPLISKEVSECVQGARKYLTSILERESALTDRQTDRQTCRIAIGTRESRDRENTENFYLPLLLIKQRLPVAVGGGTTTSIAKCEELANILNKRMMEKSGGANQRLAIMLGMLTRDKEHPIKANIPDRDRSQFSQEKYKFFLEAPFEISNKCCNVMKKSPAHDYHRQTGRAPITAQMAGESRLRTQKWIQNGCNGFNMTIPTSNPMSFWTENDVLEYIATTGIEICSVYGDIVEDYGNEIDGQISLADFGCCEKKCKYKTTGCKRTGCMLCGFGCHLEKPGEGRFEKLKQTHPKMLNLLDVCKNNGVTFRQAIEWTNEHGNLNIQL